MFQTSLKRFTGGEEAGIKDRKTISEWGPDRQRDKKRPEDRQKVKENPLGWQDLLKGWQLVIT